MAGDDCTDWCYGGLAPLGFPAPRPPCAVKGAVGTCVALDCARWLWYLLTYRQQPAHRRKRREGTHLAASRPNPYALGGWGTFGAKRHAGGRVARRPYALIVPHAHSDRGSTFRLKKLTASSGAVRLRRKLRCAFSASLNVG